MITLIKTKGHTYGPNGWTSLRPHPDHIVNLSGNGHKVRAEVSHKWTEVYHTDENLPKDNHRRVRVLLCNDEAEYVGWGTTQALARKMASDKAVAEGYAPSRPSGGQQA